MRTYWLIGEDNSEHMNRREDHQNESNLSNSVHQTSHDSVHHTLSNSSSRTFFHSSGKLINAVLTNSCRATNVYL